MKNRIPSTLRLTFAISAITSLLVGAANILAPKLMTDLASFPGVELPTYQNLGAAILGYGVGAVLALFATSWEEIRIPMAINLTFVFLSGAGGLYYFLFQGVRAPLPILDAVLSVFFTIVYGYYLWQYTRQEARHALSQSSN